MSRDYSALPLSGRKALWLSCSASKAPITLGRRSSFHACGKRWRAGAARSGNALPINGGARACAPGPGLRVRLRVNRRSTQQPTGCRSPGPGVKKSTGLHRRSGFARRRQGRWSATSVTRITVCSTRQPATGLLTPQGRSLIIPSALLFHRVAGELVVRPRNKVHRPCTSADPFVSP